MLLLYFSCYPIVFDIKNYLLWDAHGDQIQQTPIPSDKPQLPSQFILLHMSLGRAQGWTAQELLFTSHEQWPTHGSWSLVRFLNWGYFDIFTTHCLLKLHCLTHKLRCFTQFNPSKLARTYPITNWVKHWEKEKKHSPKQQVGDFHHLILKIQRIPLISSPDMCNLTYWFLSVTTLEHPQVSTRRI